MKRLLTTMQLVALSCIAILAMGSPEWAQASHTGIALLSQSGQEMEPSDALEALFKYIGGAEKNDNPLIERLIKASEVNEHKCTREDLSERNQLISMNFVPLNRYLRSYKHRQVEVCKPNFASDMKAAIQDFTSNDKLLLGTLKNVLMHQNRDLDLMAPENLVRPGSAIRAIQHSSERMSGLRGEKQVLNLLAEAKQLCLAVVDRLAGLVDIFDEFIAHQGDPKQFGPSVVDWVARQRVCQVIAELKEEVLLKTLYSQRD